LAGFFVFGFSAFDGLLGLSGLWGFGGVFSMRRKTSSGVGSDGLIALMKQFLFADEAGCLTFSRKPNVSRYFILVTVYNKDCTIGDELMHLRRQLVWEGVASNQEHFHATEDSQPVRDRVFSLIGQHKFRIDATVLEKPKALPRIRPDDLTFYKYAWYYHLKYISPRAIAKGDELLISAASIGTKKKRAAFLGALQDVAVQSINGTPYKTAFWSASSDPCLQVADYCAWAIQRKWERQDERSYSLISDKIQSEYELFKTGTKTYY